MSEENILNEININGESNANGRDLKNPKDREAVKRADDDFLKARRAEINQMEIQEAQEVEEADGELEQDALAALTLENADLKDQILRLAADMENLRRRTSRDVTDAKTYSIANFARDMLDVADNLTRALSAIAPQSRQNDTQLNSLAEGVEMTERAMISALERYGVTKIEAEGQKFDPHFHQAMFEVPDAEQPAGIVTQIVQEGYKIGDRVLRPALVGVTTAVKDVT